MVTIPLRQDLQALEGYHSPQIDVEVRLNTNEAPEAPPAAFRDAFAAQLSTLDWHRYPDRAATELRVGIGAGYHLGAEYVFAANGSNECLQSLCLAYGGLGRTVAVFEPTYRLHSHIAEITQTKVATGERTDDFGLDMDEVRRVINEAKPSLVFLCSPNNPTGMLESPEVVREVLALADNAGALLVMDEAYGQFADWSATELIDDDTPLVVSRTFSKTWSMAGARLGYLLGPQQVIADMEKVILPYHLDAAKQIAGTVALRFRDEMVERVAALVSERQRLVAGLEDLAVTQWPSAANFVLFRPETRPGQDVWRALVERSVLVRDCSAWPRLEGTLRVTIGTAAENDRFLAALGDVLN